MKSGIRRKRRGVAWRGVEEADQVEVLRVAKAADLGSKPADLAAVTTSRRRIVLVAGLLAVAVIAIAAVALLPMALTHPATAGSSLDASGSAEPVSHSSATASASPDPSTSPGTISPTLDTPMPTSSLAKIVTGQWPITWNSEQAAIDPWMGADGTLYLTEYVGAGDDRSALSTIALDRAGHMVNGSFAPPHATYGLDPGYFGVECSYRSFVVERPDRMKFIFCQTEEGNTHGAISIFGADERKIAGPSGAHWTNMVLSPTGDVVAWRNETTSSADGFTRTAKKTVVAIIGTNAEPKPGWPRTIVGAASTPTIDAGGTIYLSVAAAGTNPAQTFAIDTAGRNLSGWPYKFPAGLGPRADGTTPMGEPDYPVSIVLGRPGTVYLVADNATHNNSIIALDSTGKVLPGWPASLSGRLEQFGVQAGCSDWCGPYYSDPLYVQPPSGSGRLYLHLGSKILALGEDGKVIPGWPKVRQIDAPADSYEASFSGWFWMATTPDGGLVVLEVRATENGDRQTDTKILTRYAPDGTLAK
jgi:hypothetical protein